MRTKTIILIIVVIVLGGFGIWSIGRNQTSNVMTTAGWKTYTNSQYNFTFSAPLDFAPTLQKDALSYMFKCNADDQICLPYVGGQTSDGFEVAALEVQVNASSQNCEQTPGDNGQPTQKSINGVTFHVTQDRQAGLGHRLITDLYRTYYNSACYTIGLNIASNIGTSDKGLDPIFNTMIHKKLESILSTFKFTK
jgi:hypothetical protein